MIQALIPMIAGIAASYMGAQGNANAQSTQFAMTPEQKRLWKEILMPEITSRMASRGKLPSDMENLYLSDILGGVEKGHADNVNFLNKLNLDPSTRLNQMFKLQRDKATNTATGYRQLVDLRNKRYDDAFNMAEGLGTKSMPTMQVTNPGAVAQGQLFGDLSGILGRAGASGMGADNWSDWMKNFSTT